MPIFFSITHIDTKGIEPLELTEYTSSSGKLYARNLGVGLKYFLLIDKECFRTEKEAVAAGIKKVKSMIKSTELKKKKLQERLNHLTSIQANQKETSDATDD